MGDRSFDHCAPVGWGAEAYWRRISQREIPAQTMIWAITPYLRRSLASGWLEIIQFPPCAATAIRKPDHQPDRNTLLSVIGSSSGGGFEGGSIVHAEFL